MNKEKQILVPALRFPEFVKNDIWEIKSLSTIAENLSNRRVPITSNVREKGEIPYYGATGVIDYVKDFIFNENLLLISEDGANLIDRNYPIAYSIYGKTWVNNHAHVLKPINEHIQILIEKYINSKSIEDYLTGQAQPKLNKANLNKIPLPIPNNPKEQQKIANCLSSLDNLITAETEKLDHLKDHKKGLLQQLFPAKGETKPQFRFSEFEGNGAWLETTLDDVADYENGKAHEKEISAKGKYKVVNSKFISTEGRVVKFTNSANLKANVGDVLMVLSDIPNGRAIAKCFYVDKDDTYTVNQRICKITPTDIDNKFLFYIQNRNSYFLAFDDGVKQTNLRKDTVLSFPFLKPKDPKEQQTIANCLSSADDLIKEQISKIVALKDHKRGLMQQLFPNVNSLVI